MNKSIAPVASVLMIALASTGLAQTRAHSPRTIHQMESKGLAVAYPWVFKNGNRTSRTLAITTAEQILRNAGFASIPGAAAKSTWETSRLPRPSYGHLPTVASLRSYGRAMKASKVLYGSVSWHTRSIWVNLGPKTISTAKVDAYVFDVASGKIVYKVTGVEGRSDEKSNGYKIAAAILITPLVTAVSGGPATPREQRAVQIAMGVAYSDWVNKIKARK